MNANIWFDVAAIWLLAIQWYILILRRHVVGGQITRYRLCLALITVATVSDAISTAADISVYHGRESILTNTWFMMGCTTLYYLAHSFTLISFVMYISALFKLDENVQIVRLIYEVPSCIIITSIMMNLLTGQIFYYEQGKYYHRGPYVMLVYYVALVYLFYAAYVLVKHANQVSREKRWTLSSMVVFIVCSNFVQFIFPEMRVENFAVTVVMILVYLFIESPANYIDSRTGLLREESFFVHFNSAVRGHMGMRILFISLDDIDEWDREVGKATTDAAIVNVAGYLRSIPTVTDVYRIRRYLFLLQVEAKDDEEMEELQETIRQWFSHSIIVGNYKIGLATCMMRLSCPEQVVSETDMQGAIEMMADVEMHRNRRELRFDDLGIDRHNRAQHLDLELKEGIPHSRYRFGFQPIYSINQKAFTHVDTDVSFMIDGMGEVRFSKALSVAEQNGAIDEMYAYIVDRICEKIESDKFAEYGIHTVDIKMPMTQLLKQETIDRIVGIIDKYHVPHGMIIFELQEESLENYEGQIRSGIEQMHDRGFKFVLNNYGYGFTNAQILVKMPLVAVTLDNRLTKHGEEDAKADRLLKSTLELLRGLGLRAKAEHIESESQMKYATDLGCDLLQGYYFVGLLYDNEVRDFFEEQKNGGVGYAI